TRDNDAHGAPCKLLPSAPGVSPSFLAAWMKSMRLAARLRVTSATSTPSVTSPPHLRASADIALSESTRALMDTASSRSELAAAIMLARSKPQAAEISIQRSAVGPQCLPCKRGANTSQNPDG